MNNAFLLCRSRRQGPTLRASIEDCRMPQAALALPGGKASERKVVQKNETQRTKLSWWRTGTYLKVFGGYGIGLFICAGIGLAYWVGITLASG